ncbi:serine hydrolase domain-containing protein [Litoreibacter roseus]|uniref:Serine hydrolase n=1 Tax=Litoreibacter roseus TaxID=2601869 RepID=A0A6N6JCW0_9RHOB|nr:serine hydrolase [Litoreibacter roseus]GFE63934.1 serine hydrolase [Litoreibacter roseus]
MHHYSPTSRRVFLAGATAALSVGPLSAQSRWDRVADAARALDQLHGIVISHKGQTVLAEAFRGPSLERPAPIKSVSKTIVAALLGAAVDNGDVDSVTARISDLAPNLIPAGADPRVASITLEDLVTLRSGLERTSGANYGGWVSSSNWVANALRRPMIADPGGRMLYSTGSFHVLGAVLSEVTGQSLLQQARTRIGIPLGIDIPAWTRDPQGRYLGGNEMALSPYSMIRFGEMYRLNGQWRDQQVLSQGWVNQSLVARTQSPFSGLAYGYGWFLTQTGDPRIAIARGYGGQIIAVVPDRELTIAITSDPTRPARSGGYFGDLMRLIAGIIVPATEV